MAESMSHDIVPPSRPVVWPLRRPETARTTFERLADGRRRILINHAELKGVTPEMLAWWYRHVIGEMAYAGGRWPRYLVWHPLDHISYTVVSEATGGGIGPGARLHIREAFQRSPENLLDITVTVERIDHDAAIIGNRVLGFPALRLINRFEGRPTGTNYVTEMVIGTPGIFGRLLFNPLIGTRILAGRKADAWVQHHIEEIGNLENFLPQLYRTETAMIESLPSS
jgi:DAPG hydrolase PhiG domain